MPPTTCPPATSRAGAGRHGSRLLAHQVCGSSIAFKLPAAQQRTPSMECWLLPVALAMPAPVAPRPCCQAALAMPAPVAPRLSCRGPQLRVAFRPRSRTHLHIGAQLRPALGPHLHNTAALDPAPRFAGSSPPCEAPGSSSLAEAGNTSGLTSSHSLISTPGPR